MAEIVVIGLRWLQFVGAAGLFGLVLFAIYSPLDEVEAGLRRWSLAAAFVVALAALAGLVAQTAVMAGSWVGALDPAALGFVAGQTALGLAHLVRAGSALVAIAVLLAPMRGRWRVGALILLGLAICASFAWSGHAGATSGVLSPVHIVSDIVHVSAAGAWLGALAAFLLASRRASGVAIADLHRVLSGFAGVGTLAVVTLVLSGGFNTWVLAGSNAASAFGTAYGRWLAVKLALFAAMLGLAALNRFRLTPALGAIDPGAPPSALADLRMSLRIEAALGAGVLAVVAILGTLAPPTAL